MLDLKPTLEIINVLFLLLPGLFASHLYYYLSGTKEINAAKRLIDTVLYSFFLMMLTGLFVTWEPIIEITSAEKLLTNIALTESVKLLLVNITLMVLLPIAQATLVHHDLLHRILRKFKLTTKSSRKDTWNDTFISEQRYVVIYLKDERRIRGFPERFSDDPEEGLIYLRNPAWLDDSDSDQDYIELYTHGMLIHRENIDMIEFTFDEEGK